MKRRAYLDVAAAHPVRSQALSAFVKAARWHGNPSAPHADGAKAAALLEDARARIARETGAKSDAVIFTSGATESNALAILGHLKARMAAGVPAAELTVLYSEAQHASVAGAVADARSMGVQAKEIPLAEGALDLPKLRTLLSEGVALVTLDVMCGETGTRFDTRAVRQLIDEMPSAERPVFHVDATQCPLIEIIERTRLGADLISFDSQKIGGVRGIGALIAPRGVPLVALYEGGGQERGLRSGTPSPALALSFAIALQAAAKERRAFARRALKRKEELIKGILGLVPGVLQNGGAESAPHILNVSFPGTDTEYLAALLDAEGVSVATRSACEADAEASRAVLALFGDPARASSTLRVSWSANTPAGDFSAFIRALSRVLPLAKGGR